MDISYLRGRLGGLAFYPVTPCRVADTRGNGFRWLLWSANYDGRDRARSFPHSAEHLRNPGNCSGLCPEHDWLLPSNGGPLYYLTAWPTGQPQPYVFNPRTPGQVMSWRMPPLYLPGPMETSMFLSRMTLTSLSTSTAISGAARRNGRAVVLPGHSMPHGRHTRQRLQRTAGAAESGSRNQPRLPARVKRLQHPGNHAGLLFERNCGAALRHCGFLKRWPTGKSQPYVST